MNKKKTTSWEGVSQWYNKAVGEKGHYYHERVIFPKLLPLLNIKKDSEDSLLDLACGQGILSRHLPPFLLYTGVDLSESLLRSALEKNKNPKHTFILSDITRPLPLPKKNFSLCTILLALQNLQYPLNALKNASAHLKSGGKLFIVMNHPCFRIPRQSEWGVDLVQKVQYRRINKYSTSFEIPIQSHPSQGQRSAETFSFHHSLSQWSSWLKEAGFVIEQIEEWHSDKQSTGKHAKMEDTSRLEIPLFLCFVAKKL